MSGLGVMGWFMISLGFAFGGLMIAVLYMGYHIAACGRANGNDSILWCALITIIVGLLGAVIFGVLWLISLNGLPA